LIPRRRARAVLTAAVATRAFDGAPDVPELVAKISRLEALGDIPRLPAATVRRGVQLLLDRSESMTPYLDDLADLEAAVVAAVGQSRVAIRRFRGPPLGNAARPSRRRQAGAALKRGIPVLLATDFGLGGPLDTPYRAELRDWRQLADAAKRLGIPIVALVPYHPDELPGELRNWFPTIHWDPLTTAGDILRVLGKGQEIAG
jgi:hypothetical protein